MSAAEASPTDMREARDVVADAAGVVPGSALHRVLAGRADVMAMTQATHDAALTPADPGGLSHAERAALATRVARLSGDEVLAAHYAELMGDAPSPSLAAIADPAKDAADDARLAALVAYTDLVTTRPRDAEAADIESLKHAGIADADIVRLAELVAFLAYQVRVVHGLRLMGAAP